MSDKIKVLNLYAGIGGNRKLWKNVKVTAVEIDPRIAAIYKDFFPDDEMIIGDAHKFLLENFKDYDFIWSSPPCQTHSQIRYYLGVLTDTVKAVYPDMRLYEEIILLKHHFKGKWVVENVRPYYELIFSPQKCGRHFIWSNFLVGNIDENNNNLIRRGTIRELELKKGFDLSNYSKINKKTILRNCINPETGLHIFNCAFKLQQKTLI